MYDIKQSAALTTLFAEAINYRADTYIGNTFSKITATGVEPFYTLPQVTPNYASSRFTTDGEHFYIGYPKPTESTTDAAIDWISHIDVLDMEGTLLNSYPVSEMNGTYISDMKFIGGELYFVHISETIDGAKVQLCNYSNGVKTDLAEVTSSDYYRGYLIDNNGNIMVVITPSTSDNTVIFNYKNGALSQVTTFLMKSEDATYMESLQIGDVIYLGCYGSSFNSGGLVKFNPTTNETELVFSGSAHSLQAYNESTLQFIHASLDGSAIHHYTPDDGLSDFLLLSHNISAGRMMGIYIYFITHNAEVHQLTLVINNDKTIGRLNSFDDIVHVEAL